jgi:hypothetical protein
MISFYLNLLGLKLVASCPKKDGKKISIYPLN